MKTLQQLLSRINKMQKDDPIFFRDMRLKSLKSFHPAPSFWALIPVRIETIKIPQREQKEPSLFD